MDIRMYIPDKGWKAVKKEADKRWMTGSAFLRLIVAEKLEELNKSEAD